MTCTRWRAHAGGVHRCAELIGALTGAQPPAGFVHAVIGRAAAAVAEANKAIRALIILAHVVCAYETPIRVGPGPKTRKGYLLVACTSLLTYYFPGGRSAKTFAAFVFPDCDGAVVVHDRYQNYDAFPGLAHQLCTAHLLRDLADMAETYRGAHWPVQIRQALQRLIHAANQARTQGLAAIPGDIAGQLIKAFRHGVILGLGQVKRVGGRKQAPCRELPECLRHRQDDVLRFAFDLRIPPTSKQAAALGGNHPAPVRHPRLHLHRPQARRQRADRAPRRAHRQPVDAAPPRSALSPGRPDPPPGLPRQEMHQSHRWRPECLRHAIPRRRHLPCSDPITTGLGHALSCRIEGVALANVYARISMVIRCSAIPPEVYGQGPGPTSRRPDRQIFAVPVLLGALGPRGRISGYEWVRSSPKPFRLLIRINMATHQHEQGWAVNNSPRRRWSAGCRVV
jgi:transposase